MNFIEQYKDASNEDLDMFFMLACSNNNLEAVKYLLTSPELMYHPSLTADNEPLRIACNSNFPEMVKYFLSSPNLKEHANIYENEQQAFKDACNGGSTEVLQYLIFEYNIEETPAIKEYLNTSSQSFNETIKNMFILREVNKDLNNELTTDSQNIKKPKL
jgi:hypothetical protein